MRETLGTPNNRVVILCKLRKAQRGVIVVYIRDSERHQIERCRELGVKVEANQLKIHFPRQVSEAPDAYEEITISTNDGKRTASTIICLSRTFKDEGQPDPEPEPLPEEAKFKMKKAYFTPLYCFHRL